MVNIKRKKRAGGEFSAGSMADITFLLLLFFLVTTNIDVDTGIGLTLPEYVPPEEQELVPLSKERLAALLINENGDVLLNGEVIAIPQITNNLKERIESKINLPKNKKLVVSIKTDRNTNYNLYIQALDQVKEAFFEVREAYSMSVWGTKRAELSEENSNELRDKIPIIISIAEPEAVK